MILKNPTAEQMKEEIKKDMVKSIPVTAELRTKIRNASNKIIDVLAESDLESMEALVVIEFIRDVIQSAAGIENVGICSFSEPVSKA